MDSSDSLSKVFNGNIEAKLTSYFLDHKQVGVSKYHAINRPGHFGENREKKFNEYDDHYGKGNWKIGWFFNGDIISFDMVCGLYTQAYFEDSFNRADVWDELINTASDVYDDNKSNVKSGYNYWIQETDSTHIQDIAVRWVLCARGLSFKGDKLVQVRGSSKDIGKELTPGKVSFNKPDYIVEPIGGWWNKGSVEEFYQSAKVVVVTPEVLEDILKKPDSLAYNNYLKVAQLVEDSKVA